MIISPSVGGVPQWIKIQATDLLRFYDKSGDKIVDANSYEVGARFGYVEGFKSAIKTLEACVPATEKILPTVKNTE